MALFFFCRSIVSHSFAQWLKTTDVSKRAQIDIMELTAGKNNSESFFGDGTFEKPRIKFYFTKPCTSLGIEGSTLPDFGTRPAFLVQGDHLVCDLCGDKFLSGMNAVKHWQQETLRQFDNLREVNIPTIEVRPSIGNNTLIEGCEGADENENNRDVKQFLDRETLDTKSDNEHDKEENKHDVNKVEIGSDDIEHDETGDYTSESEDETMDSSGSHQNDIDDYLEDGAQEIKLENVDSSDQESLSGFMEVEFKEFKTENDCPSNNENESFIRSNKKKGDKVLNCQYEDCDYETGHGSLLRRHVKHVHELIRYDCNFCDLKGIGRDGLRKHIKRKHTEKEFVLKEHASYHISQSEVPEKNDYKCDHKDCSFKASNPWLLKRHNRNVHEGVKYDCNFCELTGLGYEGIRKHMKTKHGEAEYGLATLKVSTADLVEKPKEYFKDGDEYVCKKCNHRAHILDSLRMHIKRKHTEKPCNFCEFKAENYSSLKDHADAEHGGIMYPCKYCEKNLVSEEGLRRHELHYHSEKFDENAQLLFCDQCDFQSYGKYQLKRHMQSVHAKDGISDQCPYCEYVGKSRQRVLRHIKTVHEGLKVKRSLSSQCDMCEYRCSGPSKLAIHMGAKHGINREVFYCDQCDFTSNYITSVNNHKKWKHEGEVFRCDYCEFTSRFKQFLQNHIDNKHLGIKHNCDECDYAGASAQCLVSHKNSQHLGIKYPCDQCDYKASQQGSLYLHKKAKHENIRFNCEFCDFSASFKGNLRAHMKKNHAPIQYMSSQ